jgi:predicted double-glycine peptidase
MGARLAVRAALAVWALCWAMPAAAQVRLSGETGGNYTVDVMSWWQIPFRTVVRQQYDFSCGSAAVATMLTYHYRQPTPERVAFAQMWKAGDQAAIRKIGFSMLDMKDYLAGVGLNANGYRLGEDGLRKLQRPAIVLLDLNGFKHFVVVKGFRGDRVLVGDPMLGLNQYAIKDFMKLWNGIALAVVPTPQEQGPTYNVARDWGPWSKAPMEDGAMHIASDDFITHLPPSYQLSPQILLDVNVGSVR